jgi:hypothetical protein
MSTLSVIVAVSPGSTIASPFSVVTSHSHVAVPSALTPSTPA